MTSWLNGDDSIKSGQAEKTAGADLLVKSRNGRINVKMISIKPVKGKTLPRNVQATVSFLNDDGREYASHIAVSETVTFFYATNNKGSPQARCDFALYSVLLSTSEMPHRFRRKDKTKSPVACRADDRDFLGEGGVDIHKEWPKKGSLEFSSPRTEVIEIKRDGTHVCSVEISIHFVPEGSSTIRGPSGAGDVASSSHDYHHSTSGPASSAVEGHRAWSEEPTPKSAPATPPGEGKERTYVHVPTRKTRQGSTGGGAGKVLPGWMEGHHHHEGGEHDDEAAGIERGEARLQEISRKAGALTEAEMQIFCRYDGGKGHITPPEFAQLLHDMRSSGINVEYISRGHGGCCGYLVKLPGESLIPYLTHNHTLFSVCYGFGPHASLQTSLFDRLFLIIVIFLYSVCLTIAGIQFFPHFPYQYRIIVQSFVDVFGLTFIKMLYTITHRKECPACGRYVGDGLLFAIFIGLCLVLYLKVAREVDDAVLVLQTFGPNWLAGRLTEVFKVAAVWAVKVQYGSAHGIM